MRTTTGNTNAGVDNKTVRKLLGIIGAFQEINDKMPAQTMWVFLMAVSKPEITLTELTNLSGLASSTITRNVARLGKIAKPGTPPKDDKPGTPAEPGYDLLDAYEDAYDRRIKRVRPTKKGVTLYNRLVAAFA